MPYHDVMSSYICSEHHLKSIRSGFVVLPHYTRTSAKQERQPTTARGDMFTLEAVALQD